MSYCEEINCGYYWQEDWEEFPSCHFEGDWQAPCEEDDYIISIGGEEEF